MTTDEVEAIWGSPDQAIESGSRFTFVYGEPKLTITFKDGKVIEIQ